MLASTTRRVAAICRQVLRPEDLVARWGGEEFALLLPKLDLADAVSAAERLRRAIGGALIRLDGAAFGFTISIGLVACGPDETVEQLINRADSALYEAKLDGRDRVVTRDAAPASAPRPASAQPAATIAPAE